MNASEIRELVSSDLKRYGFGEKVSFRTKHELTGYLFTRSMRYSKYYRENKKWFRFAFWRATMIRLGNKFGYQISYATDIGKGIYIGHRGTVIVNGKARIGDNVNLSAGVTIGQTNRGKNKGVPCIGNNVWIGTNAIVVGGINIGDDVLIAPGAYVNFDVPSHSVVIGNPGAIHHKDNATADYIENIV